MHFWNLVFDSLWCNWLIARNHICNWRQKLYISRQWLCGQVAICRRRSDLSLRHWRLRSGYIKLIWIHFPPENWEKLCIYRLVKLKNKAQKFLNGISENVFNFLSWKFLFRLRNSHKFHFAKQFSTNGFLEWCLSADIIPSLTLKTIELDLHLLTDLE